MTLMHEYSTKRRLIEQRLREFSRAKTPEEVFYELCFCVLTPQSKGRMCWGAVQSLQQRDFYHHALSSSLVASLLKTRVRFHNTKARRLLLLKKQFDVVHRVVLSKRDHHAVRDWLVDHVQGIGLKESSHFLRNIGCRNLAILDRHVLKHLHQEGVLQEYPKTLARKTYLDIEQRFSAYSSRMGIPLDCLDLLFWSRETGEVFK